MPDNYVSKFNINDKELIVKDSEARNTANTASTNATNALNRVTEYKELLLNKTNELNSRISTIIADGQQTEGNTELIDIRTGADGKVYPTAGDAVRVQIGALSEGNAELKEDLDTLNEGGLNLKEDFISRQVNEWLDEHPEATTTVQNGSLEVTKFTEGAKLKIVKDYVTPQMYGAKGDAVHDDTVALQSAIDSGKSVLLPIGNYLVSNTININATVEILGCGLKSAIVLNNDIGEDYLFNVADRLHVGFNNFRIFGQDHVGNAISIGLTYENTILRDMYVDSFKGCLLNLGKLDSEHISENVTIENCTFNATSNNGTWNQPIVKIVNQNELRFHGNRLQFSSNNKQNNPCLYALGVRTSSFCSNIFYGSNDCAVHLVNSNNNCYGDSFLNNIVEKCGGVSGYCVKLIGSDGHQITNISFISNYIYASSARKIRLCYINTSIFQGQLYDIEMEYCHNVARIDTRDATLGYNPSSGNAELLMNGEDISIHRRLALMGKTKTECGYLQYNDGNQLLISNGIYSLKMIDNDLLIDSNNGALKLRDSTGKAHYIRVNNNGELKVTDN